MTDTAPAKGILNGIGITAVIVALVWAASCGGIGCKTVDFGKLIPAITNAIPQVTTTTQPAAPVPPTVPATPSTKPLPGADMTVWYDPAASGVDSPAVTSQHFVSGGPGSVLENGKGYEIPKRAYWSIVGTNYPATFENGWWVCYGVAASGLYAPIALWFEAASGTWVCTIPQPSVSGKSVKAVKQ